MFRTLSRHTFSSFKHSYFRSRSPFFSVCKTLPHIIFGENHEDEITPSILLELLPSLKKQGYYHFYDESEPDCTLENSLESLAISKSLYTYIKKNMNSTNLDIDVSSDVIQFLIDNPQLFPHVPHRSLETNFVFLDSIIRRRTSQEQYTKLFQAMRALRFEYKGIDIVHHDQIDEDSEETIALRDKKMANAYLQSLVPAVGRIGIYHIKGMQKIMAQTDNLENLANQFIFFYLYSKPSPTDFGRRLRDNKVSLSWPIYSIDCSEYGSPKYEVINIIERQISKSKDFLQKHSLQEHKFTL